jgi:hypothetical protein
MHQVWGVTQQVGAPTVSSAFKRMKANLYDFVVLHMWNVSRMS